MLGTGGYPLRSRPHTGVLAKVKNISFGTEIGHLQCVFFFARLVSLIHGGVPMHRLFLIGTLVVSLCCAPRSAPAAVEYNIVPLDPLPGGESLAFGLNDMGQVVGDSRKDRFGNVGTSRPVVWDYSGVPHELWSDQSVGGSLADINNAGEIVGRYGIGSGIPLPGPGVPYGRAFYWNSTTGLQDIGLEPVGNSESVAINDSGQVVGTSERLETVNIDGTPTPLYVPHAFIWDANTGIQELGGLGGNFTFATGINNNGQVIGYGDLATGQECAFVWDAVNGIRELPTLHGGGTRAVAINNAGQVLIAESQFGSYIWDANTGFTLDPVGGFAFNDLNQIVGGTVGDPSIWDPVYGKRQLADVIFPGTGWRLDIPLTINNAGEIVGYGTINGGAPGILANAGPRANLNPTWINRVAAIYSLDGAATAPI